MFSEGLEDRVDAMVELFFVDIVFGNSSVVNYKRRPRILVTCFEIVPCL